MVEANPSLAQAQRLAQRQVIAVRVLCERRAQEEIKDRLRREGKVKLSRVPRREIIAMAKARLHCPRPRQSLRLSLAWRIREAIDA